MRFQTEEFANKVYDILVNLGGAAESERKDFIFAHVADFSPCVEWRFGGKLGGGGKYRSTWNGVTCYSESETPERLELIKDINYSLSRLIKRKIVYVDLDGVMADYESKKATSTEKERNAEGFFLSLDPIPYAIDSFIYLSDIYDMYILSTAPWTNTHSWSEKRLWVEKHLGEQAFKKLILSHNKGLLKGDYLIDDRTVNGVEDFEGIHIHFGTDDFIDWKAVVQYLDIKHTQNRLTF